MTRPNRTFSTSHRDRVKAFALLLSVFGGLPYLSVNAAEIPANSVIADSFKVDAAHPAGTVLKGTSTEIGNLGWKVIGPAVYRADGAITTGAAQGIVAAIPLSPDVQKTPFRVQIDCQPATTDWVGLSLGGDPGDFFKTARVTLLLRPSGTYMLFAGSDAEQWKKPLLQGKAANFDATGWNALELELDPVKSLISAKINGTDVARDHALGEAFSTAQIQYAGVRFNESATMQPNTPAFDNFAVTLANGAKLVAQAPAAKADTELLQPLNQTQFFLKPNQPELLKWKVQDGTTKLNYEVRDYDDKPVLTRTADVQNGEVQLPLQLAAGFYEIRFEQGKQRFGVIVSTPAQGAPDKFFAIDAALSWLETRPQMRSDLLASLKRSGIGVARERMSWQAVNPQADQWDWETTRQFDTLRQEYKRQGIQILELFHGSPNWAKIDTKGTFPERLAGTKESWQHMAKHWGSGWDALEVWNEPDIDFGGELPADQYLPLVKTINYGFHENKVNALVGGGVFAYFNPGYIESSVKNGLLDQVDFVSFHTYAKAPALEQIITDYRRAITVPGQTPVPLWLTESGQPWKTGPERPTLADDTTVALDITMKAIEARACGIARYFSFVYPYYTEGERNFGMMGKEVTPLRSMAAYVQAVATLSGTNYVGDLKLDPTKAQRARVFVQGDGDNAVVVLYNEKPDANLSVAWNGPVTSLQSIDGRSLKRLANGAIPLIDGLTYVRTSLKSLTNLVRETPAAKLNAIARSARAARPAASAIVLQPILPDSTQHTKLGYKVIGTDLQTFPVSVRLNNLSNAPQRVKLSGTINGNKSLTEQTAEIAALGTTEIKWNIDLAAALSQSGAESVALNVSGTDGTGVAISPLSFDLFSERDLSTYLQYYPASTKVDITDLNNWKPNIGANGQMKMGIVEGAWQLKSSYKPGDRWVYPDFKLPANASLVGSQGLVIRARAMASSTVRVMIKEKSGSTYLTPFSIVPADGQWHSLVLRWQDLSALPSAPPDPNGQLDLDQVTSISLGMNSKVDENTLEVSDFYIARKTP